MPIRFPAPAGHLYGCYHASTGPARSAGSVLLLNPHGHEYLQFHRTLQQLAVRLSAMGHPVLRFDYSGCGDSDGDAGDWSLDRWRQDVCLGARELERRAGAPLEAVVGLRLGGTLAYEACARLLEPRCLVVWDPVVDGARFVEELRGTHRQMLRRAHVTPARDGECGSEELLGFPAPGDWLSRVQAIRWDPWPDRAAPRVLWIESNDRHPQGAAVALLKERVGVQHLRFDVPQLWEWIEDAARVFVPIPILRAIQEELANPGLT